MKKGQLEYDFLLAIIMFLIIYTTFMTTVTYPLAGIKQTQDIYTRESKLHRQIITRTPGNPSNWTQINQVNQIGLTLNQRGNNPQILDLQKLQEINNTKCTTIQEKLPTSTNIHISFTTQNKTYECN